MPLMNEKGIFIINGNTRLTINQIVRSPGLYCEEDKKDSSIVGTIIPIKGSWLSLKINRKNEIYAKIDKMKKSIPILLLLTSLGITRKKIYYSIKNKNYINSFINNEIYNIKKSLEELNKLTGEQNLSFQNTRLFLKSKFMDKTRYDLSSFGRKRINSKLYRKINKIGIKELTLKPEDILGSTKYLIQIINGKRITDEIDDLKNKRIRNCEELLKNQINNSKYEILKDIKEKLENIKEKTEKDLKLIKINEIINNKILTNIIKKFFLNNPLCQMMEEINPLSEITQKRKISSFGVGAIDKKKTNLNIREIHPSQFGRICPIETTEGKNAGLILSLTKNTRINKNGFLETPFYF